MAETTILAPQILEAGQYVDGAEISLDKEQVTFRFASTPVGTGEATQARAWITSPTEGNIRLADVLINGGDTRDMRLDKVPPTVKVHMECRIGKSNMSVTRRTELDSVEVDDATGGIADGSIGTAKLAAGAATAPKIDLAGLKVYGITGLAGAGAVSTGMTGAVIGERVVAVLGITTASSDAVGGGASDFEATISVGNQIQQTGTGLSGNDYWIITLPAVA
jgi:hypothetical protein